MAAVVDRFGPTTQGHHQDNTVHLGHLLELRKPTQLYGETPVNLEPSHKPCRKEGSFWQYSAVSVVDGKNREVKNQEKNRKVAGNVWDI
jgi:hypothetical protein